MTDAYHHPSYDGPHALWDAIARDDVAYLQTGIIAAALHEEDYAAVHRPALRSAATRSGCTPIGCHPVRLRSDRLPPGPAAATRSPAT